MGNHYRLHICVLLITSTFLCACSGETPQDRYDKGYEQGYSDGADDALYNIKDNDVYYDIVDEVIEDIDNDSDYREQIIYDYAEEYGYVMPEDIGYDLISNGKYTALDALRELYGDSYILGDYALDKTNNIVHTTECEDCSKIESQNIEESGLYEAIEYGYSIHTCVNAEELASAQKRYNELNE